jgi:hypothetical protein
MYQENLCSKSISMTNIVGYLTIPLQYPAYRAWDKGITDEWRLERFWKETAMA